MTAPAVKARPVPPRAEGVNIRLRRQSMTTSQGPRKRAEVFVPKHSPRLMMASAP